MRKVTPKTPHTQILCRFQFYKLPLKTNRDGKSEGDKLPLKIRDRFDLPETSNILVNQKKPVIVAVLSR
jgi:hypothetical protein